MAKAISLKVAAYELMRDHATETAQSIIVLACATALILAGQPLPL